MRLFALFLFLFIFLSGSPAFAAEPNLQSLQNEIRALKESIQVLQIGLESQKEANQRQALKLVALENGERVSPALVAPAASAQAPSMGGLSQGFNPDIGVVGTIQGNLTNSSADEEGNDTIVLKEVELNFAQYVDPYSRFDAVISFNDALEEQNANVEEAYYTRWGLPMGFTGQAGKFRSKFGKQNLLPGRRS